MIGRNDDMLKVKGVLVYPVAIEDVIQSFVPRVTGAFRIVLSEPPPRVVPPLRLRVERSPAVIGDALHELEVEIIEEMHRKAKIRPDIEWIEPMSLERSTKKTQILEKAYSR
jgi:phenylacetate-CoA ligase